MSDKTTNISILVSSLQEGIKELNREGLTEVAMEDAAEKLWGLLSSIPSIDLQKSDHKTALPQMESCAVSLWNFAVAKKTGGTLSTSLNAKLRHVACNLVYLCHTGSTEEDMLKKQIMMALKTARAWLDCDNPSMAENPLSLAYECVEKQRQVVMEQAGAGGEPKPDSEVVNKKKLEIDYNLFKVLCCKSEVAVSLGQNVKATELEKQAKEMLHRLPKETSFLSMLCYNFGVESFQKQEYEASIAWLRESFDLGKGQAAVGSINQARTLRLLANAYLEWDSSLHWQKALNAIGLANAEHSHPAGLYLKIRILLHGDAEEDRLRAGLDDILRHPELNIELGLSTIKLISQHKRNDIAIEGLRQLTVRFQHSPDLGDIWVTHLELLLQHKQQQEAKMLVENCITEHNTGSPMDVAVKKRFHLLLWEQAAQAYESKDYKEALLWYNYSLSLFPRTEQTDKNLAKLHRNRASCYLGLSQLTEAMDTIQKAGKCDPDSPHTYYLLFKLALTEGQDEKAIEALQKMTSCTTDGSSGTDDVTPEQPNIHGFICLAAQLAFEQSRRCVALHSLEYLVKHSPSRQQVLIALRCLTRLKLTFLAEQENKRKETAAIVAYVRTAYEKLTDDSQPGEPLMTDIHDEATWFMKIAWNLALQCEDDFQNMHELFTLCCKLTSLCPLDMAALVRQKTCLLMSAAASLQMSRAAIGEQDRKAALQQAISHIEDCRTVYSKMQDSKISETESRGKDTTTPVLLLLYEFEARAKLGDPDVEKVLEAALTLPYAEPKAFETMAALAMEGPVENRRLSSRSLKVAIKKHLQAQHTDFNKCSKDFHSLIELALQGGSSTDPTSRQEAWEYYMDVMDVISNKANGDYPEMEILWLMTKAWNCGVYLYSASKYVEAERWCDLGMKLLKNLGSLKANYEKQMTTVYGEILAKIEVRKKQTCTV